MRETTPARTSHGGEFDSPPVCSAMPPCFDKWCKRFDDVLKTKVQKAVPGWGEYFAKVYLLRLKIKSNSPHSRPAEAYTRMGVPSARARRGLQEQALPTGESQPTNRKVPSRRAPRQESSDSFVEDYFRQQNLIL